MSNSSIWSLNKTLSGATTRGQSGHGSDGNEGVLCIPKSSCNYWSLVIRSFSLISRTLIVRVLPLCRDIVGVFCSPSQLGQLIFEATGKQNMKKHDIDSGEAYSEEWVITTIHRIVCVDLMECEWGWWWWWGKTSLLNPIVLSTSCTPHCFLITSKQCRPWFLYFILTECTEFTEKLNHVQEITICWICYFEIKRKKQKKYQ